MGAADITAYIPHGKNNAVHLEQLCSWTGAGSTTVKKAIQRARIQGEPILSERCGYWRSEDPAQVRAFLREMRLQARSRDTTADSVELSREITT